MEDENILTITRYILFYFVLFIIALQGKIELKDLLLISTGAIMPVSSMINTLKYQNSNNTRKLKKGS